MRAAYALALCATVACRDTNLVAPGAGTGGVIVFSSNRQSNNFEIYRVSGDGRGLTRLTTDVDHNDLAPVMSPDGSRIAWEREVGGAGGAVSAVELWVMNANGTDQRVVVSNGSFNRTPTWGPDGSSLVFASFVTGNWEIFHVPLAGGTPANLTNSPFADQFPRMSPDGTRIAFHTNRDFNFEIYSMRGDGSDVRNLTNDPSDDRYPAWTPVCTRIVWTRFVDSFDLYAMSATGGDVHPVLATPFGEEQASVSPDGVSLVFQSDRTPPAGLYIVPMVGGTPRALATPTAGQSASDQQPWWGR
jgi:Tol biopolymer transport system component